MYGLGTKSIQLYHAPGYEQYPLINSSRREEYYFLKSVKLLGKWSVPVSVNFIGSHIAYKIETNDDGKSLQLQARITNHGNE